MRTRCGIFCIAMLLAGAFVSTARGQDAVPAASQPATPAVSLERDYIRRTTSSPATQPTATRKAIAADGLDVKRVCLSLGIVIGLILLLRWGGRLLFPGAKAFKTSRAVQVLSRNVISPKQQVIVLQVGRRLVVVGDSGQQMNSLCEITDPDEVAALIGQLQENSRDPNAASFAGLFGRAGDAFASPKKPLEGDGDSAEDAENDQGVNVGLEDPALAATRHELNGLMDKVRLVARQFNRSS